MSKARLILVHLGIALLAGGSMLDIVRDREHWPFSNYAMFSRVGRSDSLSHLRLFGITGGPKAREFPLYAFKYLQPFNSTRSHGAFSQMRRQPDAQQLLDIAVRDCLARYETLRRAGRHDGPPLRGMRLYELHWKRDPRARNWDRPDRRVLLVEAKQE